MLSPLLKAFAKSTDTQFLFAVPVLEFQIIIDKHTQWNWSLEYVGFLSPRI